MQVRPSLWDLVPRGEQGAADTAGPRPGYDSSYTVARSEIEYVAPEYAQVDYAQVTLSRGPGDDPAPGEDDTYSTAEALAADDDVTVVPCAATRRGHDNMTAI